MPVHIFQADYPERSRGDIVVIWQQTKCGILVGRNEFHEVRKPSENFPPGKELCSGCWWTVVQEERRTPRVAGKEKGKRKK